jgi:hypothetical protein
MDVNVRIALHALHNLTRYSHHIAWRFVVGFPSLRCWDKLLNQTMDALFVDTVTHVHSIFAEMRLFYCISQTDPFDANFADI